MTPTPGGGTSSSRRQDEDVKIEFINLVEPLVKTMRNTNNNLVQLAAAALVNLCNFSEDIKDIFMQQNGMKVILDYLSASKDEETLLSLVRLLLALSATS